MVYIKTKAHGVPHSPRNMHTKAKLEVFLLQNLIQKILKTKHKGDKDKYKKSFIEASYFDNSSTECDYHYNVNEER